MSEELAKRKLLSALCHGSIFFSATVVSIGIPIAILFISDDATIQSNAKEVLNFHLNIWLYGIIFGILTLIIIGWLLLGILGIFTLIMPILAIIQVLSDPNKIFRYPFIFRVL
ncbi:DUF4870 domain-containing protein [Crocosphaera sp. UHCC 0190]|uniref:DUF4870 domain-containing protein n=1 Tax=Crocosphaera sp. UHCC 0190 TaxID=3110246 RepID=UPI002B1FEA41|nr:DUF4870 domain-containing protein [Crocosphaera sp. UHCC 0190]MEA5509000.1 DUF4870 domain-containing protein [Crocosphaera sp. UHCC 0190]